MEKWENSSGFNPFLIDMVWINSTSWNRIGGYGEKQNEIQNLSKKNDTYGKEFQEIKTGYRKFLCGHGKLDALFHRLHPKDFPQQENGDVVMWDVIAEYIDFDFPVEVDPNIDDDNPFRMAEIRAQQ